MQLRRILDDDDGFSLVEMLVTILILGILASMAMAAHTRDRQRGQDAAAQSLLRGASIHVASCWVEVDAGNRPASDCRNSTALARAISAPLTAPGDEPDPGEVGIEVNTPADGAFRITTVSRSDNVFRVTRQPTGLINRSCEVHGSSRGGCDDDGTW